MAYEKTVWVDDDGSETTGTVVNAARMNNIENFLELLDSIWPGSGLRYRFLTDTTNSDPSSGNLKLNGTADAATIIRISETDADGVGQGNFLATWDDSTSTIKGVVLIRSVANPDRLILKQATAHADAGAYRNITVSSANDVVGGVLENEEEVTVEFYRTGDKGETGATGATGPEGKEGPPGPEPKPGAWQTPTFKNSWANFGSPFVEAAYRIDTQGHVYIRGVVKKSSSAIGTVIFTLPEGFRPILDHIFVNWGAEPGNEGQRVTVKANGDVQYDGSDSSVGAQSLDTIQFWVD